jgi:hypothetical protein
MLWSRRASHATKRCSHSLCASSEPARTSTDMSTLMDPLLSWTLVSEEC